MHLIFVPARRTVPSDAVPPVTREGPMRPKLSLPSLAFFGIVTGTLTLGLVFQAVWGERVWINEPLHSAVEALGGLAAVVLAFVLFARRGEWPDGRMQRVAVGFLGMGLLEVFHALSPQGDGFVLLRSAASLLGGLGFSLVWFPTIEAYDRICRTAQRAIVAGATAIGLWALIFPDQLPQMVVHGEFTPAAVTLNSLAAVLFLGGSAGFLVEYRRTGRREAFLFACLALLFGLAEIMFHFSSPWDSSWWFWHLLSLMTYALVLGYVSRGYTLMVADLKGALALTKRSERRLAAQYAVTRVLAESPTLKDAGEGILQAIGERLDWELGMLWIVDEPAGVLRCVNVWQTPRLEAGEFLKDSSTRTIASRVGLLGRVWDSGAPAWIPDVLKDRTFLRASVAASAGLHGAFAFPIRIGETVYGVIEFYSREIREPDEELLAMVADVGIRIGQFIERKRAEEELRQTEAKLLEEARLAEVARLVGDIGHDLKNLLTPVTLGAQIVEGDLDECRSSLPNLDPEKAKNTLIQSKEVLGMIRDSARRIQDRVKEIADSVKGLTSPPQFHPCRVANVVAGVFNTLRVLADQQGITLHTLDLETLPPIQADENRLFNAFYNLVNNAIPEVPSGGSVTVRGRLDPGSKTVVLSVVDTGKGMPPEIRDSLFTYRTISSGKSGGTGLGTKIVKDVVAAHGGRITVESQVGTGTAFHITLPVEGPASPASATPVSSS